MSRRTLRPILLTAVLAAVALLPGAGRAASHEPAWDQAKVTALADQLYEAVKDLRESVRRSSDPSIASGQARSTYRLLDTLRLIRNEARHLADQLKKGTGREETLPVVRRIEELRRDAAEDARRIMLKQPTQDRIAAARSVLEKIEPYYRIPKQEAGVAPTEHGE